MSELDAEQIRHRLGEVYHSESRRVFATLIRLLGDFDLAEEALHDAFASAAEQWCRTGVPANPRAWLVSAGRFKAIDTVRRRSRFDAFWLWQVKSMEEAIEWVKRCPNPMPGESEIEIRRVFAPEDFGEALTPELQKREEQLRAEVERYNLDPPRFENGRELLIAGLNASYTFETRTNIPAQWERFAPHLGKIPGQLGNASYGVCWNYKPGCGFDYLSGVEVSTISGLPKGFNHVRLPAQRYAVFTHRQHVSSIANTLDAIWKKWLPNSGHQAADAPCFERYGEEFDPQTGMGGFEIWLPIKG